MAELKFYRERNGDYLCVDPDSRDYYRQIGQPDVREGRATAIAGLLGSVCTTGISMRFLKSCKRVRREEVPTQWRKWLRM